MRRKMAIEQLINEGNEIKSDIRKLTTALVLSIPNKKGIITGRYLVSQSTSGRYIGIHNIKEVRNENCGELLRSVLKPDYGIVKVSGKADFGLYTELAALYDGQVQTKFQKDGSLQIQQLQNGKYENIALVIQGENNHHVRVYETDKASVVSPKAVKIIASYARIK
jgi:hypothetical protein